MIGKATGWGAAVLAVPLLLGCGDSMSSGTSQVSLALTDNPGDVDSVWVEIGEIYLQGGGDQGRVTLLSSDDADALGLIEITSLAGETLDLVEGVEVPQGSYGQMRFVVEGAVLETEDGEVYTFNAEHPHGADATGSLTCPSCDQTGIKVVLAGEAGQLDADAHILVLDFDVSQSFGRQAGASGQWVMHPVIHAVELEFTGAVSGTVDVARDGDGNPTVTIPQCPAGTDRDITAFIPQAVAEELVDDEGDPLTATTTVQSDSTFTFGFLAPDGYDMTFVERVAFGDDTLTFGVDDPPGVVEVGSGDDVTVEYVVTSATCS